MWGKRGKCVLNTFWLWWNSSYFLSSLSVAITSLQIKLNVIIRFHLTKLSQKHIGTVAKKFIFCVLISIRERDESKKFFRSMSLKIEIASSARKCWIWWKSHTTYLSPISCSVVFDCMLFERSSSHHSGNDDWKFGKPSVKRKEKINDFAIRKFNFHFFFLHVPSSSYVLKHEKKFKLYSRTIKKENNSI